MKQRSINLKISLHIKKKKRISFKTVISQFNLIKSHEKKNQKKKQINPKVFYSHKKKDEFLNKKYIKYLIDILLK